MTTPAPHRCAVCRVPMTPDGVGNLTCPGCGAVIDQHRRDDPRCDTLSLAQLMARWYCPAKAPKRGGL
jgi:ribosomal protein S27AE